MAELLEGGESAGYFTIFSCCLLVIYRFKLIFCILIFILLPYLSFYSLVLVNNNHNV